MATIRTIARKALSWAGYAVFLAAIAAISAEILTRIMLPAPQRYFIWPPGMHVVFQPSDEATPGISGPGHFIVNSLGLRSDEPLPDRARTMYVFGGSTAADVYLDQREAWVTALQDTLNGIPGEPKTWVGNLGRSSLLSIHALLQFQYLVGTLPKPDVFINLTGWNDFQFAIKSSYLLDMTHEDHMNWTFSQRPAKGDLAEIFASIRFYRRVSDWWKRSKVGVQQTHTADGYITWKKCRQAVPEGGFVDQLPDLSTALAGYRQNLNRMVDEANRIGAPIVFATQPMLWSERFDPESEKLLYTGGIGPNNVWCKDLKYYSSAALARGVKMYNDVTLDVCKTRNLFCIDLAAQMAGNRELFWDDGHFNEAGARFASGVIAREVSAFMRKRGG